MSIRSMPMRVILLVPLVFLLQGAAASWAAGSCNKILGNWAWFIGGNVAFSAGAHVLWTPAAPTVPPATGTWHCAASSGTYTVNWQNGFVDTLTLSDNGNRLEGTSSTGVHVWGKRTSAAQAASASPLQKGLEQAITSGLQGLISKGGSSTGSNSGSVPICSSIEQTGCWHTLGRGGAGYEELNRRKGAFR